MSDRVKIVDNAETKAFLIKNFLSVFYDVKSEKITLITGHFRKDFNKSEFYNSSKSFGFNQFITNPPDPISLDSTYLAVSSSYSSTEKRQLLYFTVNKRNSYHYQESLRGTKSNIAPSNTTEIQSFTLPEKTYQKLYRFFYEIFRDSNPSEFFFYRVLFKKENGEWSIKFLNIEDKVLDVCREDKVITVFTTNYVLHFLPKIANQRFSKVKNIYLLSYSGGRNDFYSLKIRLGL